MCIFSPQELKSKLTSLKIMRWESLWVTQRSWDQQWLWRGTRLVYLYPFLRFGITLMEKEMATHSSTLAWESPMDGEAW